MVGSVRLRLSLALLSGSFVLFAGCGGGSSNTPGTPSQPSNPTPTDNPVPGITSIAPTSLLAGSASQTLTLTGTGFVSSSVVNFNSAALATSYVSSTSVTAVVPAVAIAADGPATVTVTNPTPGGGSSVSEKYTISVPTPQVASLSPASVTQGAATTVTISGSGFEANSVAQWNGAARPTTFVNATILQMALTAADTLNYLQNQVTVANPGLPPTTPVNLAILAMTPVITSINPNSVAAYTGSATPQLIYISGTGFAANATVQANGQIVPVISNASSSITVSLAASYFASAGTINIVVSNPGVPVVSSNGGTLTVTAASTAASFSLFPNATAAGSPDTTITLSGTGFFPDTVVSWNNTPLATTYVNPYTVTAIIPAADITGFVQASVSVSTPEDTVQPSPQPFDTYLALEVNDIVYNSIDGLIYASVPGSMGDGIGNSVVGVDPTTGVIKKTIFAGSEPNRLALSSDGTQLFVGLNGAGAVAQLNLTTATSVGQFSLGGGSGVYNPPFTAVGLAAVPGKPNSVAVYVSSGVVTIYDSGVARTKSSSGLQTYFGYNVGGLAFGNSASTLYAMSNAVSGYLYQLTVDATGVTAATQLGIGTGGSTLQYDNGLLYVPEGIVFSATTGDQVGQFSIPNSNSTTPAAAVGPIVSDSTLNLAWIVQSSYYGSNEIVSYNETTYDQVESMILTGINANATPGNQSGPADLIRWGQDGLAFHTGGQLYVLNGPIVKDNSGSPADLSSTIQAPASGTTGSLLTYTVTVSNAGPNTAQGTTATITLPESVILGSVTASQGYCTGSGVLYCDLGSISNGGTATITSAITPTNAGTIEATAAVSSVSYDPVSSNNQASASTAVTGAAFSAAPLVTQISPTYIQAGSNSFIVTVDGEGFNTGSTVLWNGQSLPTTYQSAGQLTATVDASLIAQLGWSLVSVSTPAPGGGQSGGLPFSIYETVNVPANTMAYDPFTQKLYAVLPSSASPLSGNSIVAIDPATGNVGTPVQVGSEPNLLSETSDGDYMYIGLSGAKSLGRFNLLTQSLDLTVPLPGMETNPPGQGAAIAIATVPGSDSSLAVEENSFYGIGIFDISGSTGTFRSNISEPYDGDNPVFADSTHFYAYDAYSSGSEFYRYSISSSGVTLIDGTTLEGMGGYGGRIALDGGQVYGAGGGIINPSTTPPSQVAELPLGTGLYGTALAGGGVIPYAAEAKSFNIAVNDAGTAFSYIERFDTQHFTLEDVIPLPNSVVAGVPGTRWGQDGLAYLIPGPSTGTSTGNEILLIRGPFVLPAEAASNAAPQLTAASSSTIAVGSGNLTLTITGSGFLPGATVFWNGASRTTTYVDSGHVSVAIPASDVIAAGTITIGSQNPGSPASNTITVTVQ